MGQWAGVILAAGIGSRMKSRHSKVLHPVCGKEMIRYPVELFHQLGIHRVVVVVSPANSTLVDNLLADQAEYTIQAEALGTSDALTHAQKLLSGNYDNLLVLGGDSPLVTTETVKQLMASHAASDSPMTVLTGQVPRSGDWGRIIRDGSGQVTAIMEAAEMDEATDSPGEINGGVYCFSAPWLWENLERIKPGRSGERYLTSLAAIGAAGGSKVIGIAADDPTELQGVNNRLQLAQVEEVLRQRIRQQWMLAGVTMVDPSSVYIDADVYIGQDTLILPNTMLLGRTKIGEECQVGPGSVIRDSTVGSRCRVTSSMLEEATMEEGADIGPFSHLRPGAYLESGVHIGNFAEVKESRLGSGVLMGHFGYVGDASIGANANLGAGMVTCNFDGKYKHRTVIEEGAFVGCDTMLVAPVKIGAAATTGAGAVVTNDVPSGRLAVGVPAKIVGKKGKAD